MRSAPTSCGTIRNLPKKFWRTQHHTFSATNYIRFVRKLPTVMALLRRNEDPSADDDDNVKAAYDAFFADSERVLIEKTPSGWRVTSGHHRIMACIATGSSCLADVVDCPDDSTSRGASVSNVGC